MSLQPDDALFGRVDILILLRNRRLLPPSMDFSAIMASWGRFSHQSRICPEWTKRGLNS